MDNLVLIRVAAALDYTLSGSVLQELRGEGEGRLRLIFAERGKPLSLTVSLNPDHPWLARPPAGGPRMRAVPTPFASTCTRALRGAVLAGVDKPPAERVVHLRFAGGKALVAELIGPRANLVLIGAGGEVLACARRTRSSSPRFDSGVSYAPLQPPAGVVDPFGTSAAEIDAWIESRAAGGESLQEVIKRRLFGVGEAAARLVAEECRSSGKSPGAVIADRLAGLVRGGLDPVIESAGPPLEAARRGELDLEACRMLPWSPSGPASPPMRRFREPDPAATAGVYHEAVETARLLGRRAAGLLDLLDREIRRLRQVELRVAADLVAFEEPERFRIRGEALLAGLSRAQRAGGTVLVPDPYDTEERLLAIPAPPGRSLQEVAENCFQRHRRAKRGLSRARARAERLAAGRGRLERLRQFHEEPGGVEMTEKLERGMRAAGIPVGLEPPRGKKQGPPPTRRPRLEGVRLFTSSDGLSVLVGKSGKENQRLTFRLAAPEDFWLHALGVPGAHVVVRNDERKKEPPRATLHEAAAAAAWFSEARNQTMADVQWTRRKYVRKIKGALPGTVRLKRFETVRVRPRRPPDLGR